MEGGILMKIRDIMTKPTIFFTEEDLVINALNKMDEKKINGAPVINKDNEVVGMIVKADIYRFLTRDGHTEEYPLNLVMSKNVISANPEEDIKEVALRLRKNDIIALPIIENNKLIGFISIEDILDYLIS